MSESKGVQILTLHQVTLTTIKNEEPIKLSFLDTLFTGLPPIQRVFLYSNPTAELAFSSIVEALKSSLSDLLPHFLPLSGKLTYLPSTGDVQIDVSSPGVTLVEAGSDLDLRQLTERETHDFGTYARLAPGIDTSIMPFPVFAVQVTRFGCGGVAVGFTVHHSTIDGKALCRFLEELARSCKAKVAGSEDLRPPQVLYDRAVIKHPKGEEMSREFLRILVPNLPKTVLTLLPSLEEDRIKLTRRTLTIEAHRLQHLKQQAKQHESRLPSTFVVVSTYVWATVARAKRFDPNETTFFCSLMDIRAKFKPPVDDDYFGNCIRGFQAGIVVGELTATNDGLSRGCSVLRDVIDSVSKDPLGDCESWVADFTELPMERVVNAAGSPRFQAYEVDFGWGRPEHCQPVNLNRDGEFALLGGKGEGAVQISIALDPAYVETFTKLFLDGLAQ